MTPDDISLLGSFFNFGFLLLLVVVLAWTRHGQPESEQKIIESKTVQFIYRLDADFSCRERDDRLSDAEKRLLLGLVESGAALTFRAAADHGIKRAAWNHLRGDLVGMGLADYGKSGDLVILPAGLDYLKG